VRFCIPWIAAAALSFLCQPCGAQEPDVGSLPLTERSVFAHLQTTAEFVPEQQDNPDAQQKRPPEELQRGTPNDRILWTLPNFLTVENADEIPPLSVEKNSKSQRGGYLTHSNLFSSDLWLASTRRTTVIHRTGKGCRECEATPPRSLLLSTRARRIPATNRACSEPRTHHAL
jgi:hypothetical protein